MDQAQAVKHSIELAPSEEERCRSYARAKLAANAAEFFLLVGTLGYLTFSGLAQKFLAATHVPGLPNWLGDLSYLLLIGFVTRLVLFPAHLANEHWLERRYGLTGQKLHVWLWEWLCRSAVFGVATICMLLPVVETLPWWKYLIVPWCVAFVLLRGWFYEYVYYPLLNCFYPVTFLRHETFSLPGVGKKTLPVYQVKVSHRTRRVNASIRLRGERTAIYVTDTLIDEFTDGEERVVMAHEFGHLYDHLHLEARTRAGVAQAHRKLAWGSVQLLAGVSSFLALHVIAPNLGLRGVQDLAGFPLLAAATIVLANVLNPLLCAEARRDERDADEYALAVTGDVHSYLSVMRKLRRLNLEESHGHGLTHVLFDTHPSYAERVLLAFHYRRRHRKRKVRPWRGWRHIQRHGRR